MTFTRFNGPELAVTIDSLAMTRDSLREQGHPTPNVESAHAKLCSITKPNTQGLFIDAIDSGEETTLAHMLLSIDRRLVRIASKLRDEAEDQRQGALHLGFPDESAVADVLESFADDVRAIEQEISRKLRDLQKSVN